MKIINYGANDFLVRMFFLFHALLHGTTGLYLLLMEDVKYESPTYRMMSSLIPLELWGSFFLIASILYVVASFQEGRSKYWYMLIAGLIGTITFGLYAMASAELTSNIMISTRYSIIASFNAVIALVGVLSLWTRKT